MLITHQHPLNKSIMVAVLGAPNVGKSSLINNLMGTELSIVTQKPQTTRNRFHCVLTIDRTEIILVDTPGIHITNKEFNKRLTIYFNFNFRGLINLISKMKSAKNLRDVTIAVAKAGEALRSQPISGRAR